MDKTRKGVFRQELKRRGKPVYERRNATDKWATEYWHEDAPEAAYRRMQELLPMLWVEAG